MKTKVLSKEEAEKAKVTLIANAKGTQAVHDVVVAMQANRRSGTANTKTKGEVNRSGKKPWRQKGTGRARAGDAASPIWVGGGVVFGPKPRDYSKNVPKAVKKLAFRKAFSARVLAGDVLIADSFAVEKPKTKAFVSLLNAAAPNVRKALIIGDQFDANTYLAARNVQNALLVRATDVNTEQLLAYDKIVVTRSGFEQIAERLSK